MRKIDLKKISLGTAHLGSFYGMDKNRLSVSDFSSILKFCRLNYINQIDTAYDYFNSENIIGNQKLSSKFNITSKIIKIPKKINNLDSIKLIENKIKESLRRLKKSSIYSFLFHESEVLFSNCGYRIYDKLIELKKNKIVKKIGISVYDINELEELLKYYDFDIVQIPINILNQNFLKCGMLKKLKNKKIIIQARSIFLQGLLLKDYDKVNIFFSKIKDKLNNINDYSSELGLTRLELCLNYIFSIKEIDTVIIGVDSLVNLQQIVKSRFKKINYKDLNSLSIDNKKYIDPRKWNINLR